MNDSPLIWLTALGLSAAGSLGGLLVASLLLWFHKARTTVVPWLVSYAVGTLLGAATLGLLPEALEVLPPTRAFGVMLFGILTFFILEKLVLLRHCHDEHDCEVHSATTTLVIVGDAVHTFVDGVAIAAATLISPAQGVVTAVAAIAHEIPQEAGDFGILLAAGHTRRRAMILNATSAIGGLIGASLMLLLGARVPLATPYVLAFAAGTFLYVAMSDLIPHLHRGKADQHPLRQVILIALGLLSIGLVNSALGH